MAAESPAAPAPMIRTSLGMGVDADAIELKKAGKGARHINSQIHDPWTQTVYLAARAGSSLPDLNASYRWLISSQLITFHHAARYSGRRLLYFR